MSEGEKHAGGRPTKFDPKFCDDLIEHMEKGGSFESFPAILWKKYRIKVTRQTLYNWKDKFDEFFDTMDLGVSVAMSFYENIGSQGMAGQLRRLISETKLPDGQGVNRKYKSAQFNYRAWQLVMMNRFGYKIHHTKEFDQAEDSSSLPPQVILNIPSNGRDDE